MRTGIDINISLVSTVIVMKTTRSYTMTARAQAVEATRTSILDALVELAMTRLFTEIALDDVAARAGVSVQTVLRHFGSRDGLVDAAMSHALSSVADERQAPHGDVAAALRVIVDHYEERGRASLMMLAQEHSDPRLARITEDGRLLHRRWVEEVFAPLLPPAQAAHDEAVDLLVVATDVYAWKLLRLDRALPRKQAQKRMERLVRAVLADLGDATEGTT